MGKIDYSSYKKNCVKDLCDLQEKLKADFNLDFYESWYYDQSTGLLTLSTDDHEVNFKYVSVGTYSRNTKTWKWSWDNEHTLDNVKSDMSVVKSFGEAHQIEELTKGQFDADEQMGWEFAAIATKLLSGIGAYRVVSDHLLIFMVLIEKIENDEAKKIKDQFVSCGAHGSRRRAFICKHLDKHIKRGFEEAFESYPGMELEEDDDFQAWCDLCEVERQKEGDWNDKSMAFADIRLVCEDCYFEIKKINS